MMLTTKEKIIFFENSFQRIFDDLNQYNLDFETYIQVMTFLLHLQHLITRLRANEKYSHTKSQTKNKWRFIHYAMPEIISRNHQTDCWPESHVYCFIHQTVCSTQHQPIRETQMNDEIKQLLSIAKPEVFTLDPKFQTTITRQQLDKAIHAAKSHLAKKKTIHIILVKAWNVFWWIQPTRFWDTPAE